MDDATKRAYIETRLAKARDDLLTAQDDLQNGHWRGAPNRAYYAVFHVASAVLLWLDIERARHSGTQAAFNEFLVKPGKLEPEFGQIYSRARKAREEVVDHQIRRPGRVANTVRGPGGAALRRFLSTENLTRDNIRVEEYLDTLQIRDRARVLREIELLEAYGPNLRMPHAGHLRGKLWELRIDSRPNSYWVLYAAAAGRKFVLLHCYAKKSERTPESEIEMAERHLADYLARSTQDG